MNRWLGAKKMVPGSGDDEPMSFDLASSLEAAELDYAAGDARPAVEAYSPAAPPAPQAPEATYFDSTTELQGSIKCSGSIGIDGKFEGDIQSDAFVVVGHEADVRADISAESVIVAGRVQGNIVAAASVEIQSGGSVIGNLTASELHIDSGGVLKGQTFTGTAPDMPVASRSSTSRSGSRSRRAEREPATANGSESS
jgi:cytoskeletal protein CcmA (bactofilin family)